MTDPQNSIEIGCAKVPVPRLDLAIVFGGGISRREQNHDSEQVMDLGQNVVMADYLIVGAIVKFP
jgi:hypothetical protein